MTLVDFVRESNRIEGITREPTPLELAAHSMFLALNHMYSGYLSAFVRDLQPGTLLRERVGMNVRVGEYFAPLGGTHIEDALDDLLERINAQAISPYAAHVEYERLHPFMDGNGRSGRALWLWQMGGIERVPLGFLHTFYYQTLAECRP